MKILEDTASLRAFVSDNALLEHAVPGGNLFYLGVRSLLFVEGSNVTYNGRIKLQELDDGHSIGRKAWFMVKNVQRNSVRMGYDLDCVEVLDRTTLVRTIAEMSKSWNHPQPRITAARTERDSTYQLLDRIRRDETARNYQKQAELATAYQMGAEKFARAAMNTRIVKLQAGNALKPGETVAVNDAGQAVRADGGHIVGVVVDPEDADGNVTVRLTVPIKSASEPGYFKVPDIDRNPCGEIKLPEGDADAALPSELKPKSEADRMMDFFGGKSEW